MRWKSPSGKIATLHFERFASLHNQHLFALRCRITPEFDGQIELRAALNTHVDNEGLRHWVFKQQGQEATRNAAFVLVLLLKMLLPVLRLRLQEVFGL